MKNLSRILGVALFACLFPAFASAQSADLRIEDFSVYSTQIERDGFRRVSVSFRVVNRGSVDSRSATTRVTFGKDDFADFVTPELKPGKAAYISRFTRTTAPQVAVLVRADTLNGTAESNETNNTQRQVAQLREPAGRWLSIGPAKIQDGSKTIGVGRVTTIAVDPRSADTIYLGARGSGLWKSLDAGVHWFPIGDSLPSAKIDVVSIYPRERLRVVVATPAGVFESKDGGAVWAQLTDVNIGAIGSGGGALLIADAPNPALYVSTTSGLKVSTDGGHTWPIVHLPGFPEGFPNPQVVSLQFSTTDPSHLFASTTGFPGVFEGKQDGLNSASWHMLTGCGATSLPTFPANAVVWIAESKGHRWVSFRSNNADGGEAQLWRSTSKTCASNGFTEHEWERVPLGDTCGTFGNNFSYLFAHPNDPSIVFKGGQDLCRSTQSGSNLGPVSDSQIHKDHHAIVVATNGVMFFGSDGGIYRSLDKGKTMEFLGEGLNNTEFLKIDTDGQAPRLVVGGTQDNGTSTWNGVSPVWEYVGGGDSSLVEFDRADRSGIYETGQSTRQLTRLQPGGGSRGFGDTTLPECCTYIETPALLDSMVSTGGNPRLLVTCQGIWSGPPWRQIQPSPAGPVTLKSDCEFNEPEDFSRLKLHPSGVLVAATNTGHVFYGRFNQPPLPEVFKTPGPASASAISFDGPKRFYIATNSNGVGRIDRLDCVTGCTSENVLEMNGEITAITVDPLAPNSLVVALRNQGIRRGSPSPLIAGRWNWTVYNNGLPFGVTVTDLEPQSNGGIIAATFGRGSFQLFSRIVKPPSPQAATGFVTSYEIGPAFPDRPAGANNPMIQTLEIDSKPGFSFTSTGGHLFAGIIDQAENQHRKVVVTFTPIIGSPSSGRIVSVKLK